MATLTKRRNGDRSTSWDPVVRIVGYPPMGKSFRTKIQAEIWAARTESAAKAGMLPSSRGMTLGNLIDEALPRLTNPTGAAFAYWREHLGDLRLDKITPELIALHRDRLLGADCRGYEHKHSKPAFPGDRPQLSDRTLAPVHLGREGDAIARRESMLSCGEAGDVDWDKVGPKADGQPGGCNNVLVTMPANGAVMIGYRNPSY